MIAKERMYLTDRAGTIRVIDTRTGHEETDVQAVLEGSILVDGDRLRVIAQLIDAQTGYHIWSETFDRKLEDIFAASTMEQ